MRSVLRSEEKAIFSLRTLYQNYGYLPYKVNKFEEYDLYMHNKNFLVSDKVLAFTDTNGKLMALKPDVTLSIIKNYTPRSSVSKYYYNETVYRPSTGGGGFKEIMQTGLECIGNVGLYDECEVIMLAAKSLGSISGQYILDLSHMGFVDGLLEAGEVKPDDRKAILGYLESKNRASIERLGLGEDMTSSLCLLTGLYLPLLEALAAIKPLIRSEKMQRAYDELAEIAEAMKLYKNLYLDFSMVSDQNYYDGVIFKGYIGGIPESVLSGGRYDKLLEKMEKKANAIGFAVYLDRLERFDEQENAFDVDVLLVYDKNEPRANVLSAVERLTADGKSVFAVTTVDPSVRAAEKMKLVLGEVTIYD